MSDNDEHIETENVQVGLRCATLPKTLKYHLITSIHNWCLEAGYIPFIVIDVRIKRGEVFPMKYLGPLVNDNQLIFNLDFAAAIDLVINKDIISFNGRFGGTQTLVSFSPDSVIGIFSKQTRVGFFFPPTEQINEEITKSQIPTEIPRPKGKPTLTIVK